MCRVRLSLTLLLSAVLLFGQWPLSTVTADALAHDHQPHCYAQTDGEHHCAADHAGDACHPDQSPEHCAQDCACDLACSSCTASLAAIIGACFQPRAENAATLVPPLFDGLILRPISPEKRPPRSLFG